MTSFYRHNGQFQEESEIDLIHSRIPGFRRQFRKTDARSLNRQKAQSDIVDLMPTCVSFHGSHRNEPRGFRCKDVPVPFLCGLASWRTALLCSFPFENWACFHGCVLCLCTPEKCPRNIQPDEPSSGVISFVEIKLSLIVAVIIAALSASKITRGCAGWTTGRLCLLAPIATAFRGSAGYHVTCAPLTLLLVDPPKDSFGPFAGGRSPRRARKPAQTRWQSRRRSHWIVPGNGLDENERERERNMPTRAAGWSSKEARPRRRLSPSCEHVRGSMLPDARSHPDDHCHLFSRGIFHILRRTASRSSMLEDKRICSHLQYQQIALCSMKLQPELYSLKRRIEFQVEFPQSGILCCQFCDVNSEIWPVRWVIKSANASLSLARLRGFASPATVCIDDDFCLAFQGLVTPDRPW